jgi:hypothetical protein
MAEFDYLASPKTNTTRQVWLTSFGLTGNSLRFGIIADLQTLLLSGREVFTVIDVSTSEHCESGLRSCLSFH